MQLLPAIKRFFTPARLQERIHPSSMTLHDAILYGFTGGMTPSTSGVYINEDMALNCASVLACIKVLSEDTASLPLLLYRRLANGKGKERATSHPLFPILHLRPNNWMSSMQYREVVMHHLLSWGNHYSQIVRVGGSEYGGRISDLVPLNPSRMTIDRDNGELLYRYVERDGRTKVMDRSQVFHVAGLGFDGIVGYSPIQKSREAIGLSIAVEEFGSRFFSNGANSSIVLTHPQSLSKKAKENLKDSFDKAQAGLENVHRTIVLEEGMTIEKLTIPPDDAQFLATRRFQKEEIASIYRVPLHMIQDLERSTYSNIEHQSLSYVIHALMPWFVRIEQAISTQLLGRDDSDTYFAEHLITGLLRGDVKSRYEAYAVGRQWGWLSANDIRELENLNPIDAGDVYLQPLNMVPAGTEFTPMPKTSEPTADPDAERAKLLAQTNAATASASASARSDSDFITPFNRLPTTFYPVLHDAIHRSVTEETQAIRKQVKKVFPNADERAAAPGLEEWITAYYLTYRRRLGERVLVPFTTYLDQIRDLSLLALSGDLTIPYGLDAFPQAYIDAFVARYTNFARNQLLSLIRDASYPDDIADAVTLRLDEWMATRAEKVARDEATRMLNASMRETWKAKGVVKLRWTTVGDNCPFCTALSGRIVGIDEHFLGDGEVMYVSDEGQVKYLEGTRSAECGCDEASGVCTCGVEHRENWQALKSYGAKFHPPIHRGCDCRITPVIT